MKVDPQKLTPTKKFLLVFVSAVLLAGIVFVIQSTEEGNVGNAPSDSDRQAEKTKDEKDPVDLREWKGTPERDGGEDEAKPANDREATSPDGGEQVDNQEGNQQVDESDEKEQKDGQGKEGAANNGGGPAPPANKQNQYDRPIHEVPWQDRIDDMLAGDYKPHELNVKLGVENREEAIAKIREMLNVRNDQVEVDEGGWSTLELPRSVTVEEALHQLKKSKLDIRYAEPNFRYRLFQTFPDDPQFDKQWGLHNTGQTGGLSDADIDAPEAWDTRTGASNVTVAVLDSGVDYTHSDLDDNMWNNPDEIPGNGEDDDGNGYVDDVYGVDISDGDSNPMPSKDHGTHVAGILGAEGDNGIGVTGVNMNVSIMAVKIFPNATVDTIVNSIDYARNEGANVMNASFGNYTYSDRIRDAIDRARGDDIMFVAAAGNNGNNNDENPAYPASYTLSNIISVAATDSGDELTDFSNYGSSSVDLAAPGKQIYSTIPDDRYEFKAGTSMACPMVAGAIAYLMAEYPGESLSTIRQRVLSGVDPLSNLSGKVATGGRLNLNGTLENPDSGDRFEPNERISEAEDLGTLDGEIDESNLSIHDSNDDDYFQFDLPVDGDDQARARILFTHTNGDLDLALYDSTGNKVASSVTVSDNEEVSLDGLSAGTYYLRVYGYSGATNSYDLQLDPPSDSGDRFEPNESISEAEDLGELDAEIDESSLSIHNSTDEDYFKINLPVDGDSQTRARILFSHTNGDLDFELLDDSGNSLSLSASLSDDEEISLDGLSAGTYYLRVYGYSGATNSYDLQLDPPAGSGDRFERNDEVSEATDLGALDEEINESSLSIHDAEDVDYFKIDLPVAGDSQSQAQILFSHASGNLDLFLYDSDGNQLDSGESTTDNEVVSLDGLSDGTYYLIVGGKDGATNEYDLELDPPAVSGDRFEYNDDESEATDLGDLDREIDEPSLSIHDADDVDAFEINLSVEGDSQTRAWILFGHASGNLDLFLFDADANLLDSSESTTDNEELSLEGLSAGTYYLVVAGNEGATNKYDLQMDPPAASGDRFESNDEASEATDLGTLDRAIDESSLSIHDADDLDVFQIELPVQGDEQARARIRFSHNSGDLDLYLYDSDGNRQDYSISTSNDEEISLNGLSEGTYYVLVRGYDGATNSYDLQLDPPASVFQDRFEPNETISGATGLGTLDHVIDESNLSIHTTDDQDFFKIDLSVVGDSQTRARILFNHARGDLDLYLFDDAGNQLDYSISTSNDEELSLDGLSSGTYYIGVQGFLGETNSYDLQLDPPASVFEDRFESNESISSATDLGSPSSQLREDDLSIHDANDQDYFQVQFDQDGTEDSAVSIFFNHGAGDLDMELLDDSGNSLAVSNSTNDDETISMDGRSSGTYYVRVYGYSEAINNYDLQVTPPSQNTTNTLPDAPTNPSPSDGATGVSASPTLNVEVADADGDSMDVTFYDASDDSTIGTDSGVSDGGTASVTWFEPTADGNSYSWYAVADDGSGSTQSSQWSFSTEDSDDTTAPTDPSGLTANSVSTSRIDLSWDGSADSGGSGLAGYKIERSTDGGSSFSQIDTTSNTSYSDTGLDPDRTFTYRVRAYDNAGNNSGYSNTDEATTDQSENAVYSTLSWPMFGRFRSRDGFTDQTGNLSSVEMNARFSTEGVVYSSPAVADLDADGGIELVVGSRDQNLYALESDGNEKWSFSAAGDRIDSSPAIGNLDEDGAMEVVAGSHDGNIYAVDSDGTKMWEVATSNKVMSSPAISDIDEDGSLDVIIGSRDGKLYVLGSNGSVKWTFDSSPISSSPAIGDVEGDGEKEIVVGSSDSNLYVLEADGSEKWRFSTGNEVKSSPVVGDLDGDGSTEIVFGSNDNNVYALESDGTEKWRFSTGDLVTSSPALGDLDSDGNQEVVFGSHDNNVYVVGSDGREEWSFTTGGQVGSSPAVGDIDGDGDHEIVIGSNDNKVYALQTKIGEQWSFTTDDSVQSSPALADIDGGNDLEVAIGSDDNNLYVLYGVSDGQSSGSSGGDVDSDDGGGGGTAGPLLLGLLLLLTLGMYRRS